MSKKPSIYLEEIGENKQHNKTVCMVKNKENINEKLDEIFQDKQPLYMKKVQIETNNNIWETRIYERKEKELITLDRKKIAIDEIKDIKRIS